MFRTVDHINAELLRAGLGGPAPITSPWYEDDELEREAEQRHRLRVEIEEWCRHETQARIKIEFNPVFAKVGLRLTKIPGWGRS